MSGFNPTKPARTSHPGAILFTELSARGLSIGDAAALLGYDKSHIWDVIDGNAPIDVSLAVALSRVLGTSAQLWLNLEAAYRASQREEA